MTDKASVNVSAAVRRDTDETKSGRDSAITYALQHEIANDSKACEISAGEHNDVWISLCSSSLWRRANFHVEICVLRYEVA